MVLTELNPFKRMYSVQSCTKVYKAVQMCTKNYWHVFEDFEM
jgi:hypothetical protein